MPVRKKEKDYKILNLKKDYSFRKYLHIRTKCANLFLDKGGHGMISFVQKMLEISIKLDKKKFFILRITGKILGIFPVWYCGRMEKKLFSGKWDPLKKYRKRYKNKH